MSKRNGVAASWLFVALSRLHTIAAPCPEDRIHKILNRNIRIWARTRRQSLCGRRRGRLLNKSPTLVPTGRVVDSDRAGFRVRRTFMLGFHRASDLGLSLSGRLQTKYLVSGSSTLPVVQKAYLCRVPFYGFYTGLNKNPQAKPKP